MKTILRQESKLLVAWSLSAALILVYPYAIGGAAALSLRNIVVAVVIAGYGCVLLRYFRGDRVTLRKSPSTQVPMGVWGYVWRFLVVYYITRSILAMGFVIFVHYAVNTVPMPLIWLMYFTLLPLMTWALFGKDRMYKLQQIVMAMRGY